MFIVTELNVKKFGFAKFRLFCIEKWMFGFDKKSLLFCKNCDKM